jgi:hypothetical protein
MLVGTGVNGSACRRTWAGKVAGRSHAETTLTGTQSQRLLSRACCSAIAQCVLIERIGPKGAIVKCRGRSLIQAASLTSIPSTNLAPEIKAWRQGDPFNARQRFDALSISLKTIVRQATRLPLPFVFTVRSRTVANVDSIGLVVRMWRQCSAGKSRMQGHGNVR